MARRRRAEKRKVLPDPKFGDVKITKFMNCLMIQGKKSVAESIVYGALEQVQTKTKEPAVATFHKILDTVRPQVEVRSRRVGGATYQVPVEVREDRGIALAMRWIIDAARKRGEKTMIGRLVGELMDITQGRGTSVKKREDTHKMAEANKAFAHYKW
ncbi:MAG: 30S ribosomal protein S7 [Bdellovibrionales bacterium]